MIELSWIWYPYAIVFMLLTVYLIKAFVQDDGISFGLIPLIAQLVTFPCLFGLMLGFDILPEQPYLLFGISCVLGLSGFWLFFGVCTCPYPCQWADEDEDEDENEDDEELAPIKQDASAEESDTIEEVTPVESAISSTYRLAIATDGVVSLDGYRPPVDPAEFGRSFATLFSANASPDELEKALDTIGDAETSQSKEDDDEDEDLGIIGVSIYFAFIAPSIYLGVQVALSEAVKLGWL
ncbi:hypothetical protein [Corallincola spongiicola]|uniref:Uncharacterized protein n=1 Tax=Corallincola spongiicola TaxID=2520508 RepID=A0ABY1WV10_9GAMM|nr:hypothetical protein [Corallincola spongiicola]TAA48352.1 hypothetical protein EXY25_03735 [Corallincola spongiicola]